MEKMNNYSIHSLGSSFEPDAEWDWPDDFDDFYSLSDFGERKPAEGGE